jgi:flagellar biogenesis protein FliO
MSGPSWLGYLLAVIMIVTAVYCVSRLTAARLRGRPTEPAVDIVHVLMGVAMAGVLVPRLSSLPDGAWEAMFGAALAWFGWQAIRAYGTGGRAAHHLPHLLASGAMLYMFLAASPAGTRPPVTAMAIGGQSAGTARFPVLALALALALFGYAMWVTDRLPSLPRVSAMRLAPAVAALARPGTGSQPGMTTAAAGAVATGWAAATAFAAPGLADQAEAGLPRPRSGAPLSPRLAACCEIVMGITMGYMLILML